MSTLILVFHPHLKDGSRVNARLLAELTAQGEDDIIVRDEYAEYPNFSVNADKEHELLEAADRVILQFPFYWYSSPALLKEWEDEVITAGWAYAGAHALKGKELKLVVTTGSDAAKYRKDGEYSHTMEELLKLPGVGRKTANLILGDVYHTPGVVVADTHCIRISGLLGLTDGTKVLLKDVVLPEGAELDMDDPETSVVSVEVPEDTTESAAAAPAADADAK